MLILHSSVDLKNAQHELQSFIWGKMRTAAWETVPQIAVRNFSKEAEGKGQYICDLDGGRHTIKHIFLQVSAHLLNLFPVTSNSRHHEGLQCFSRNGEM